MNEEIKNGEKIISQKINVTEIQILADKPNAMYINGLLETKEDKTDLFFVSIDKTYREKICLLKTKINKENIQNNQDKQIIYYFDIDLKNIDMEKSYYLEIENSMLKIPNQTYKGKLFNLYITDNVFYIHSNISVKITDENRTLDKDINENKDITTDNSSNINGAYKKQEDNIKSKKEIRRENRRKNKRNKNKKRKEQKESINNVQNKEINTICVQNVDNFSQIQPQNQPENQSKKEISKKLKVKLEEQLIEKLDDINQNIRYETEIQSIGILNSKDKGEYIWFELSIDKYIDETVEFLDVRKIKVYLESSNIEECIEENSNSEIYQNEKFKIQNAKKHYGYVRKNLDGLYYFDFKILDICNYMCKYTLYIEIEGNSKIIELPEIKVINEYLEITDGKIQIKKINNLVPKTNPINNISYLKYNISFLDVQKINGLDKIIGNLIISKVVKGKEEIVKHIPKMYIVSLDKKYIYELKLIKINNDLNIYYFELNLEGKPKTKYILQCFLEDEELVKDSNSINNSLSDKYIQLKNVSISIKGEELEII